MSILPIDVDATSRRNKQDLVINHFYSATKPQ